MYCWAMPKKEEEEAVGVVDDNKWKVRCIVSQIFGAEFVMQESSFVMYSSGGDSKGDILD